MPRFEFAVLGAGALGSIIGAHLARAGHEVVLLARGRRAGQVAREGVRITGLVEFTERLPVITDPALLEGAGTFIVTTKAIDTAAALAPYRHADIGAALSVQNGLLKDELLAGAFGADKVLGSVADASGELLASGEVLFTRNEGVTVGEPRGGPTARARRVAEALDHAGINTAVTERYDTALWTKFAVWTGLMVLAVTTRRLTWQFLCDPGAAIVFVRLVREVGRLATASGVAFEGGPSFPVDELCRVAEAQAVAIVGRIGAGARGNSPTHRVSTLQDLEAGRRLEVDETLGHAVQLARRLGLDLPLLDNFHQLISAIDRTQPSALA